jgi:hypothetical protein
MDYRFVNEGMLSFKQLNSFVIKIPINSFIFGRHLTKKQHFKDLDQNLVPLFLYSCLRIDVELNEFAFFVPIFNARIQDLTNASVNDTEYSLSKLVHDQNTKINSVISKLKYKKSKFSRFPRSNTTKYNSVFKNICNIKVNRIPDHCLYKTLSMAINGNISGADNIRSQVKNYLVENPEIATNLLTYEFAKNFDVFDSKYYFDIHNADNNYLSFDKLNDLNKQTLTADKNNNEIPQFIKTQMFNNYINGRVFKSFGTFVDLFAFSEIMQIPIEFYISYSTVGIAANDAPDINQAYRGENLSINAHELNEFTFYYLKFVVLINGHINKDAIRITYDSGSSWGLIKDYQDMDSKSKDKFYFNPSDIFLIERRDFEGKSDLNYNDIINYDFFAQIKIIYTQYIVENNIIDADITGKMLLNFLRALDKNGKIFKNFYADYDKISDIFLNGNYNLLYPYLDVSKMVIDDFYNGEILNGIYLEIWQNYAFDKNRDLDVSLWGKSFFISNIDEIEYIVSFFQKYLFKTYDLVGLNRDQNGKLLYPQFDINFIPNELRNKFGAGPLNKYVESFILIRNEYLRELTNPNQINATIKTIVQNIEEIKLIYKETKNEFTIVKNYTKIFLPDFKSADKIRNINVIDPNQIMNSRFIEKLLSVYGYSNTYEILSNFMPDLFEYKRYRNNILNKLKAAEESVTFDYSELWTFISSKFLKKFNTNKDLLNYAPFNKYDSIFKKYEEGNKTIKQKMIEVSDNIKDVNFDMMIYKKFKMLPIIGLLVKIQKLLYKNNHKISYATTKSITDSFYIDKIKQLLITSSDDAIIEEVI